MPTTTTTYSFNKPVVGADEDDWGGYLNGNWDSVDDLLDGTTPVTGIDINSGTLDGVTIGGTTAGAGTFTNLTATGTTTLAGASTSADITFGDNDKAIFGAGSDLQIYHTGTYSLIADTSGTGPLRVVTNQFQLNNAADTANLFKAIEGGAVTLYYDNASKLATTSTGVDITGTLTSDGLRVDGNIGVNRTATGQSGFSIIDVGGAAVSGLLDLRQNDVRQTRIYNSSSDTIIRNDGGDIYLQPDETTAIRIQDGGDISFYEDTGTTAKFFWDASAESLGIGTTSPAFVGGGNPELTISGTISYFNLQGNRTAGAGNATGQIRSFNGSTEISRIATVLDSGTTDGAMLFSTASSGSIAERLRIDSSGNVGIGTTSPSVKLHMVRNAENTLRIEDTLDSTVMDLRADSVGGFVRTNGSYPLRFLTNNAERMRIDSSGNLLVGTTDINPGFNDTNTGSAIRSAGSIFTSVDGSTAGYFNRNTNDGDIVSFRKDGSPVGSIGAKNSVLLIGSGATGLMFESGGNDIIPRNTDGSNSNGSTDLGSSTSRFKDLYLSGGVYLGGTGSANKLDDYEEGTFTPTFVGSTGGTVTLGSAFNTYAYTKIGRIVTITGRVDVSGTPSLSGNLLLQGLPFTSGNLTDQAGYTVQYGFITIGASNTGNPIVIELQEGTTEAALRLEDWTTASGVLVNNSRIQMSITYFTS